MKKTRTRRLPTNIFFALNKNIFSPLVALTFGSLAIDTFTYPGFLAKFTGVSPTVFIVFSAISCIILLLQKIFLNSKLTAESQLTLRINLILLPFLAFIFYSLNQLELTHYPNYVFSTFHIHLPLFQKVIIFSVFLLFLYVFHFSNTAFFSFLGRQNLGNRYDKKIVGPAVFFITMLFLLASQLPIVFTSITNDVAAILRNPLASFADRKTEKFGKAYRTYNFIIQHTESDGIIAVPPQLKWGIMGNIGFSRYFLYPRFLVHPEDFTESSMPDIDYYLIAESIQSPNDEEKYQIWPTTPIPAESIYVFDELRSVTEKIEASVYDPSNHVYRGRWGIIKVAK